MSVAESPVLNALFDLSSWRQSLVEATRNLATVTAELDLVPSGVMLQMESMAHDIEHDRVRIAFVGEFSRGKTELINALFFSDMGHRLMPSSTGQTTMCPVEIQGALENRNTLRLLPIASRSMDASIEKLKKAASAWQSFPLSDDDQKGRVEALSRLAETVCVAVEDARKIGLCPPLNQTPKHLERTVCPSCGLGKVLIPRWRHALLSLSHPVLDAGLTILDTPGLNAIGAEPELTLSMLADADAIVFLLGADTGVTQSDLMIWDQYLIRNTHQTQIVLLNKIDMLWDELRSEEEIWAEVEQQIEKTANRLRINPNQVIPISGQKGLIARIKKDDNLLARSGMMDLEKAIANIVIAARYNTIRNRYKDVIKKAVMDQKFRLQDQRTQIVEQMDSVLSLKERSAEKIPAMVERHKKRLRDFESDRKSFEGKKESFRSAVESLLLDPLTPDNFDQIIRSAKEEMLSAWTTGGIVGRFQQFFEEAIAHFDKALEGAEKVSALMSEEYKGLQTRYHMPDLRAVPYAMMPKRAELMDMAEKYERFGMKLEIAVNTQSSVVKKTFLTVATKTRDFVMETRKEAETWVDSLMEVMQQQMQIFQDRQQEEIKALEQIAHTVNGMDERIADLKSKLEAINEKEVLLNRSEKPLMDIIF